MTHMYILTAIWLFTPSAWAETSVDEVTRILAPPSDSEMLVMRRQSDKIFSQVEDPFSEKGNAAMIKLEKLIWDRLLSAIPRRQRHGVNLGFQNPLVKDAWGTCGYVAPLDGTLLQIPKNFYNSGVGNFVRIHEGVHQVQSALNFNSISIARESFGNFLELKQAFQTEKMAMDWEWVYAHLIPTNLSVKIIEALDHEIKNPSGAEKAYELGNDLPPSEFIQFYESVFKRAHNNRRTYLRQNWDAERYAYSPYTLAQRTMRLHVTTDKNSTKDPATWKSWVLKPFTSICTWLSYPLFLN